VQIRIKIQEVLKAVCFVVILRCVVPENFHTHAMGEVLQGVGLVSYGNKANMFQGKRKA